MIIVIVRTGLEVAVQVRSAGRNGVEDGLYEASQAEFIRVSDALPKHAEPHDGLRLLDGTQEAEDLE